MNGYLKIKNKPKHKNVYKQYQNEESIDQQKNEKQTKNLNITKIIYNKNEMF